MKKGNIICILVLLLVFIVPLASADIVFNNLSSSTYNIGDDFNVTAIVSQSSNTNSFFTAKLSCANNGNDVEIYRAPYSILAGEQKTITIEAKLEQSLIGDIKGQCIIKGEYLTDIATSSQFEITNSVSVIANLNETNYNPGSSFTLSGTAIKKNNVSLNGLVHITSDIGLDSILPVSNGQFSLAINIPKNARARSYSISMEAYESDSFNVTTNTGSTTETFSVNSIPTKLDIATSLQQINPGDGLTYSAVLTDQAGDEISNNDIQVSINTPSKSTAEASSLKSSQSKTFETKSNSAAGIWTITANTGSLTAERVFGINEIPLATFAMVNDTLTVTNTGNTPYVKTIQILIGENRTINQDLNIPVDQSAQFKLSAPTGEYNITINTGTETKSVGSAFLTGRVIDAQGLVDIAGSKYAIGFWVIIILVLAWLVFRYYRKTRNPSYSSAAPKSFATPIKVSAGTIGPISSSDQGDKQECLVIALKIKNLDAINASKSNALESINLALAKAREFKASIYEQNEFRMIVIPKALSRTEDLALVGAKVVKRINDILEEHNKKYNQKINYGLGANLGELIVQYTAGKFKYSPLGNTIQIARRIAEGAQQEALISEKIRNRAMKDIKVERKGDFWSISSIKDHSANNEFINRFMSRNKPENK